MSEEKFNPANYMRQLKGRGGGTSDYLDVKWRLVWLRSEHPEARIVTEPYTLSEQVAIFRAEVAIPEGGSATGWGSETPQDFRDYIEKAETKALGRALIALGYGAADAAADESIDSQPVEHPARNRAQTPNSSAAPAPAATNGAGDPPYGADLGWTDFWAWAKPRGYKSKDDLARALGKDVATINGWTAAEIRTAVEVSERAAPPAAFAG